MKFGHKPEKGVVWARKGVVLFHVTFNGSGILILPDKIAFLPQPDLQFANVGHVEQHNPMSAPFRYLLSLFVCVAFIERMAANQSLPASKREVTTLVEKAVVIAIVDVAYEEKEIRFELAEILFSSQPIPEKSTIHKIPRQAPTDLRRVNVLMFFPRFPPKNEDLVGYQLEGDHLVGSSASLTEVKEMIAKRRANQLPK